MRFTMATLTAESQASGATAPRAGVRQAAAREAWDALAAHPAARLVDVRTPPEWKFVGAPNLAPLGKETILLSFRLYPDFVPNPAFAETLARLAPDKAAPIFFLCRTGGRSQEAAELMTARGYAACANVVHGFEGDPNAAGQRGKINGWKAEGLSWRQA